MFSNILGANSWSNFLCSMERSNKFFETDESVKNTAEVCIISRTGNVSGELSKAILNEVAMGVLELM